MATIIFNDDEEETQEEGLQFKDFIVSHPRCYLKREFDGVAIRKPESILETGKKYRLIYPKGLTEASRSSAPSLTQSPLQPTFAELLRRGGVKYNDNILARGRRRFSSQMSLVLTEQSVNGAKELYEIVKAQPQTKTELALKVEGYTMDGLWYPGNDNLIICFKGTRPKILKTLNPSEFRRVQLLFDDMREKQMSQYLTSFELTTQCSKSFMIMPFYPPTLELIDHLKQDDGIRLFDQISLALDSLHSLDYNHMDVKPSNICLREDGSFVLIDLGSVVKRGDFSDSTVVYVPRDFQPRKESNPNSSRYEADEYNDWLMLGMTIAEKVYSLEVGYGCASPPSIDELINILGTDGIFKDLINLFPEMKEVKYSTVFQKHQCEDDQDKDKGKGFVAREG